MTTLPILLLDKSDTDTGISWWDSNRTRLNEVIQEFNAWQADGFGAHRCAVLKASLVRLRQYGENNDFSDWQFEEIDKMESHITHVEELRPACTTIETPRDVDVCVPFEGRGFDARDVLFTVADDAAYLRVHAEAGYLHARIDAVTLAKLLLEHAPFALRQAREELAKGDDE